MILSIIIPSYNHEEFVLSTLQAASTIDIQDKEIIVIDDGSRDASTRIIREYITRFNGSDIRLVEVENHGLVNALNIGLSLARGRYFYAVASDDIPIPEGISRLIGFLENNSETQFVIGNVLIMYSEKQREFRSIYGSDHRRFFAIPSAARKKEVFFCYPDPLLLQGTVFRTSALKAVGGWREDVVLDDLPLFIAMFSKFPDIEKDFRYQPSVMTCLYRQHQSNSYRNVMRQFALVEQAFTTICPLEWRSAAIARKAAYYCLVALRQRRTSEAAKLFHSLNLRAGIARSVFILASELCRGLAARLSKLYDRSKPLIAYVPSTSGKE